MGRKKKIDRKKLARLVREGKSDREIAKELGCSPITVKQIRTRELGIKKMEWRKHVSRKWKLVKASLEEIEPKRKKRSIYKEILKEFLRRRMKCARLVIRGAKAEKLQSGLYNQAKSLGILKKIRIVIRKGKVYLVRR